MIKLGPLNNIRFFHGLHEIFSELRVLLTITAMLSAVRYYLLSFVAKQAKANQRRQWLLNK